MGVDRSSRERNQIRQALANGVEDNRTQCLDRKDLSMITIKGKQNITVKEKHWKERLAKRKKGDRF